ncbi:MAG TPA: CopD family protein [Ktedonobacteraceae bacterium]|nr:CopD family protein [Ktedonobacteraceae bacterium]
MNRSRLASWTSVAHRLVLIIFPLAFLGFFLFPQDVSAHAILLRSSPNKLDVLTASPAQVYMWFSEDLNPAYTTAFVIKAGNSADDVKTHVDKSDAHVSYTDSREMDLSLKPNLPSAVYIVLYRTQSADDGHILYGFFLFKVAAANRTVPVFNGTIPQPYASSVEESGGLQLDAPALLSFVMTTLVDLGTIFWVGAQIWFCFVLPDLESEDQQQQAICEQMQQRFNRGFSWSVLLLVLLANMGVLIGQALSITGGDWGAAFEPILLISLVKQGHFGTYWIMREIVILLALFLLAVYTALVKQSSQQVSSSLSWGNFALGVALLVALTQSGHAAATSSNVLVYAVLADFLHLAATALWIGGMMYIAVIYLPVLKSRSWQQQTASLLIILPRYSPLALTGVVLMGLSGPLNAATRLLSWNQLFTTVYGLMLIVKVLLVVALLLTSAFHVLLLRPRLAKDFKIYQAATEAAQSSEEDKPVNRAPISVAQVKKLEARIKRQTRELSTILRWEPVLGIAVLLCTGLLTVFSSTLQPTTTSQPTAYTLSAPSKPFTRIVETTDNQLQVTLRVDRIGS